MLNDHQRALQKLGQYKKKKMSATVNSSEVGAVEQLEQRILKVNYMYISCLPLKAPITFSF